MLKTGLCCCFLGSVLWVAGCAEGEAGSSPQGLAIDDGATDRRPEYTGRWSLDGGAELTLAPEGELTLWVGVGKQSTALKGVMGLPAVLPHRVAFSQRPPGSFRPRLMTWENKGAGWGAPQLVLEDFGQMDRVALSEDGAWIAFVSAPKGWATLYLLPFSGGEVRALTNQDLQERKGKLPLNFVPPPHRGPPVFEGESLVWLAPDGEHRVELP